MSIESRTKEKVIDGVLYIVAPLPFSKGNPALTKLNKIVMPVVAKVFANEGSPEQAMGAALECLSLAVNQPDLDFFTDEFGEQSKYRLENGNPMVMNKVNRELHFAGKYDSYYKWLGFCIEVNFGSFFGALTRGDLASAVSGLQAPST